MAIKRWAGLNLEIDLMITCREWWLMVSILSCGSIHGLDVGPLCARFKILFELAENRPVSVKEMCRLGCGVEGDEWK